MLLCFRLYFLLQVIIGPVLEELRKTGFLFNPGQILHLDRAVLVLDSIFDQLFTVPVIDRVSEIGYFILRFISIRHAGFGAVTHPPFPAVRRLFLQGALSCLQLLCKRGDFPAINPQGSELAE